MANLQKYKNCLYGKKCFIMGNGPSLSTLDLDRLMKFPTFSLNQISLLYPNTKWRPTYYVNVSSRLEKGTQWYDSALESMDIASHSFLNEESEKMIPDEYRNKASFLKVIGSKNCSFPINKNEWSDNPENYTTKYGTTLLTCFQLAQWMGVKVIYLIGCDLSYKVKKTHFIKNYLPITEKQCILYNTQIYNSHCLIKGMCERAVITVYNCGTNGNLDGLYRKKNYNNVTK